MLRNPLASASPDRELLRRIWALSWPMMMIQGLETLVGLFDFVLIRSFGPAATAALGVSRQVTFVAEALVMAISAGAIALVSQGTGAASVAGRPVFAPNDVVRQCLRLTVLLAVPVGLLGYGLSGALLSWMQASPETRELGEPYLQTYFAGLVFVWLNLVAVALYRGAGDVWTPLKVAVVVSTLHPLLNYLFIGGAGALPAYGVPGAALGAVAARACGVAIFLYLLWRGVGPLRLDFRASVTATQSLVGPLLRIGVPMALANLLRHGSRVVFLGMVGASVMGMSLQAAAAVGFQVRLLTLLIPLAFQTATATLVGQAIGRGDYAEAEALGRRSVQLLALGMLALLAIIWVAADPLASLLVDSPDVAELTAQVLRWFAVAQFFSALSIGTQGALIGAGDTLPALRYTLISEWCLLLPVAALFVWLDWVPDALLAAWALAPALTLVLMQRRFRSGRWKTRIHT